MRVLAEKYGWCLRTIQELTMYQAMIFAGAYCPEDGQVKLSPEQAKYWSNRNGV